MIPVVVSCVAIPAGAMKICLEQIGKRYQRHWVFKNVDHVFELPGSYALLGANGSGKSTLLRIIAGMQSASVGKLTLSNNGQPIALNECFPFLSFCAPGMELPEELTLREMLQFHFTFKKRIKQLTDAEMIGRMGLEAAADKQLADYSSGMKQRVKLALALFSDTPALFLDEPCTNLDEAGVQQYLDWIAEFGKDRLVIVASNDAREYAFCQETISLANYK